MARTRTLLLVDDDLLIRRALADVLEGEGYRVLTAASGQEGLELLRQHVVEVVISDHVMPGMGGLQFLSLVKDRYPDTLRIMLTGSADFETAIDAINRGAIYRFLTKPCDEVELKTALHSAFEQAGAARDARLRTTAARHQRGLLSALEREHPGIGSISRAPGGAIILD